MTNWTKVRVFVNNQVDAIHIFGKVKGKNECVAVLGNWEDKQQQIHADLISAAPKLLESLKEILGEFQRLHPTEDGEAIFEALNAISQAEGKQIRP